MSSPLSLELTTLPLADVWDGTRLAADFLRNEPAIRPFYRYGPDFEDITAAVAARRAQPAAADRAALVAALRAYHARLRPTASQLASLDLLANPQTVAVVTGQQPGLFGGPLYTFHKAVTAVVEARRLCWRGIDAVPLFWVATEDDDWEEVRGATWLDRDDAPQQVSLAIGHRHGQSVGSIPVDPLLFAQAVAPLAEGMPDSPFVAQLLERIASACSGGCTWGEVFSGWMSDILGDLGLLFVDSMQPELRALSAPLMARVLDDPLAPTRLSEEVGDQLEAAGYKAPTRRAADRCGFYLYREGLRRRLAFRDGRFHSDAGETFSTADLQAELATSPESFSHSLLLRPVVQDYLLPTAAFVVGPGEIAYLAQVGPVADWLEVARPLLVPRRSLTLVPNKVWRVLHSYDLTVRDVRGDLSAVVSRVVREGEGAETTTCFAGVRAAIEAAMAEAGAHAAAIDGSLRGAADSALNRMRSDLDKLEKSVQRSLRQRSEVVARRLALAYAWLSPEGALQERSLSLLPFLALYGPDLVPALVRTVENVPRDEHGMVRMGQ